MKKIVFVLLGLFILLPYTSNAFSGQGCGGDCMQCHKLDKKEANQVLKKLKDAKNLPPNAKLLNIKLSPVGGLWQLELGVGEKRGFLYMDFSKKNLIFGQIVPLQVIGAPPEPQKVDFKKIPLKDTLVMGSKKAKNKVVVFTDPDCPYCRKLHDEMKKVLKQRNDIAFHVLLFPLPFHKEAYKKVQTILCKKSNKLMDDAFAGKSLPDPKCSNKTVEKNIALAKTLGFNGTPVLVRNDGAVRVGMLTADKLSAWIDGK